METKEPMLRSDWAIYRGGAFLLTGTEDVAIVDSEFDQVGGNADFCRTTTTAARWSRAATSTMPVPAASVCR